MDGNGAAAKNGAVAASDLDRARFTHERNTRAIEEFTAQLVFMVEASFDGAAARDLHPGQPVDVTRIGP